MKRAWVLEFSVGLFMLFGIIAVLLLAFKVSGIGGYTNSKGFYVVAHFDHIGDLKVRAPVTIAGVRVGEVAAIDLNEETFRARVRMVLEAEQTHIPTDSSARILTEGLLGSNYVGLTPGYGDGEEIGYLTHGSHIEETYPAIVLENLIGQLLFSLKKEDKK